MLYHATPRISIALTITADRPKNLNYGLHQSASELSRNIVRTAAVIPFELPTLPQFMRAICKIWKKIVRAFRAKNRGQDDIFGSRSLLQVVGEAAKSYAAPIESYHRAGKCSGQLIPDTT